MSALPVIAYAAMVGISIAASGAATAQEATLPSVTLTPMEEVPPTTSSATGTASFVLNPSTKQLSWEVTYNDLSSPLTAVQLQGPAPAGAVGGVILNLAPAGLQNPLKGSKTLSDQQVAELLARNYYVNIHTTANPNGEIRGQIQP